MIVVDSNVLAYLYLPGEHTAAAESLSRKDLALAFRAR
jgi:predicted nucleic acid-binding protein